MLIHGRYWGSVKVEALEKYDPTQEVGDFSEYYLERFSIRLYLVFG